MLPGFCAGIMLGQGNAALGISGTPIITATEDTAYTGFTVSATGGTAPYTFSVASGALPAGITLDSSTGVVSGTPTVSGTFAGIVIRVTDNVAATADLASFSIAVSVSGSTRQSMVVPVFANSNGPRQSMLPGAFINEA